jgi:hypothetical protein
VACTSENPVMAKFSIFEHKKPHRAKRAGGGLGHRGGVLRVLFRILQMDFREFLFHALR